MQVQRIQNHNQNFTALKITKPELEWDADVLLKFETKKFKSLFQVWIIWKEIYMHLVLIIEQSIWK